MKNNKVIILGAGLGGLASAVLLSKLGFNVEIYEKNLQVGGKINEFKKQGFRFDTGATLITMPFVLEEYFKCLDYNIEDYLQLISLPVICKYFWLDGTNFTVFNDKKMLGYEMINKFGEKEYYNFPKLYKYSEKLYKTAYNKFLNTEFKITNYLNLSGLKNLKRFLTNESYNTFITKYLTNPKLIQVLDRFTTYNGSSPFLAPRFFTIIPYVEFNFGGWFIKGGIYKLIDFLRKECENRGININYGQEFVHLDHYNGKIVNLYFKNNISKEPYKITEFDILVSNFTNNEELLPKYLYEESDFDWSLSGFILFMGVKGKSEILEHHNILFPNDYYREFDYLFNKKILTNDMTIYISISSKNNPEDAPEGCENWFVLVNSPNLEGTTKWSDLYSTTLKNIILDRIEKYGIKIKNRVLFYKFFTPEDFLKKYNSEFGSIYGIASNSLKSIFIRPSNKSKLYENLYFVGGNVHPGGGIPLCFLSAKIITKLIAKKYDKSFSC